MLPPGLFTAPGVETVGLTPPSQHRRRRLLRHPADARWSGRDRARRRRRKGQSGRAPDGAAARDAAHAGRRRTGTGAAGDAAQRPGQPPRAEHAIHHAVLCRLRAGHRRVHLRQRRTYPAAGAARRQPLRPPQRSAASRSACSSSRRQHRWTVTIEPDDLVAIYSDGITEAENPGGVPSTRRGLEAALRANRQHHIQTVGSGRRPRRGNSTPATRKFVDDLTLLLLRRTVAVTPQTPVGVLK